MVACNIKLIWIIISINVYFYFVYNVTKFSHFHSIKDFLICYTLYAFPLKMLSN